MDKTLGSAMRGIAARMAASHTKPANHVRRFPRVLAFCDACGRVHTFAHSGRKLIGYGCGTKKYAG